MKKIVVPVDFSDNALKAAFYAAQLASISSGTVYLVHVLETGHEKLYQPFTLREKFNNIIISDTEKQLNEWKNIVGSKYTQVPVKVEVLGGNPPDRTAQYAREQKADLIVIGNTGSGLAARLLFGSVTNRLFKVSSVPVLTVPPHATVEVPDNILFATSHFERDAKLLSPVIGLAGVYDAVLHFLYFYNTSKEDISSFVDHSLKLENYRAFLKHNYPNVHAQVEMVEGDDFDEVMDHYIKEHGTDLLVMVSYAKGFFEKMRSTTRKMAFHGTLPVLVLPPTGQVEAEKRDTGVEKTSV